VVALTALACFGVGLWLSETPAPFAAALAGAMNGQWRALGVPCDLSNALFVLGMVIASSLVVFYVRGVFLVGLLEGQDPRKRRYKSH
jgi:hypothetical protein